ncbi:PKD domain-containing protein [Methanoregula sp.]|uniref:PKD domain-containing protein n=1 Tax=Methanoregula sp. TaxID=2052170 RepID=UPI003C78FC5D
MEPAIVKRYRMIFFLALIFALVLVAPACAATVTTISNASATALTAAVSSAGDGDTIILQPGTYFEHDISITGKSLTIRAADGHGPADTIIDAQLSGRIFSVTDSSALTVANLTLRNGKALDGAAGADGSPGTAGSDGNNGGAILSAGPVSIVSSVISTCSAGTGGNGGNTASNNNGGAGGNGGSGGAIFTTGAVTVTSSTITGCSAGNGGTGGSVVNTIQSNFAGGSGGTGGYGGAIYATGTVNVTGSTITGCRAGNGGTGGNSMGGSQPPAGTGGTGGYGGAIHSAGALTVTGSTITGCSAGNGGYSGNWGVSGSYHGNGGNGGAISASATSTVTVTGSTITGCSAGNGGSNVNGGGGGAIYSTGAITVTSNTITGCQAGADPGGNRPLGGAVYASGSLNFNRLVNDNTAPGVAVSSTGSLDARNNWWGSNNNPSALVGPGVTCDPWLVLGISASPTLINPGTTSTIQANLTYSMTGTGTSTKTAGTQYVPDLIPVTFSTSTGTLTSLSGSTSSGAVTTIFSSSSEGDGTITATVDSQSVSSVVAVWTTIASGFTGSLTSGTAPLTVQFTDTSTGSPTGWYWYFGSFNATDNGFSTSRNPSHTYDTAGTYTVSLKVNKSPDYSDTLTRTGYIIVTSPGTIPITADFTGDPPLSGNAPLTVQFHDASTGLPKTWLWSFGDGQTSTARNPSNTYATAGAYTVTLTATNDSVTDTKSVPGFVTVTSPTTPVVANFANATPRTGSPPLTVQFTDTSAGLPVAWLWSFGDGVTSTDQNPAHTYAGTGTYTVSLTAVNGTHTNTLTQPGYVTVSLVPVTTSPTIAPTGSSGGSGTITGSSPGSDDGDPTSLRTSATTLSKNTDIYLKVSSDYLSRHQVEPADIVIMSYASQGWQELPTKFVYSSGNDFYFTANADTYSLLAIGNTKDGVNGLPSFSTAMVSVAPSQVETGTSPDVEVPAVSRSDTGSQVRDAGPVVVRQTTTPPEPAVPDTGFPLATVGLIGAGCVVLAGSGFIVRRWWIRRQNPALFREYD